MSITLQPFGQTLDGQTVELFTLTNTHGLSARVINYGATLISFRAPDRDGQLDEITLGFDSLEPYLAGHPFFGSTVGRYANRIDGARFAIDGVEYPLAVADETHGWHLHGGVNGFDKAVWDANIDGNTLALHYLSRDGEEGYPGNLDTTVTYALTDDNELIMTFAATTDRPTVLNLTNHAYWNLAGAGSGDVFGHIVRIHADQYLASHRGGLPTGEFGDVAGGPMDFSAPRAIGDRVEEVAPGYDHCYVLRGSAGEMKLAASVYEPTTGRAMDVHTTQPGVQLYISSYLDRTRGAAGRVIDRYGGLCLEAQHFPDSPNQPHFPSTLLRPGETYHHETRHRFAALS